MIVYNVDRAWFTMKADAEAHRKTLGLKPDATVKLDISNRDELAGLLNGLCGITSAEQSAVAAGTDEAVIERTRVTVPEHIPAFLLKDTARRFGVKIEDIERT